MLPLQLLTPRLLLTPPTLADAPAMIELANDPVVEEMTLSFPYPYGEADALAFLHGANVHRKAGTAFQYAIKLRDTDGFVGSIGLHIDDRYGYGEIGYWMGAPYRGRGFVTEAVGALLDAAFAHTSLVRIQAMTRQHNVASARVLLKSGFRHEAVLEDHTVKNGEVQTVIQFRILRREWEESSVRKKGS
ncbi:GNAT family N-acetyltransferase [Lewinella sp. JB7]|uniref:GNAT family N-acetyltransferase n=1 Tax=Lewinella sp. JB7 TaxID=2962887 RepID=UPI0020C9F7AA|nr:GNAT family N-acetyltransferase [Lewinella sp. JB7]MCP9235546.1 GNAT family N-acetyltransferase [Lewinella sp. JB7]